MQWKIRKTIHSTPCRNAEHNFARIFRFSAPAIGGLPCVSPLAETNQRVYYVLSSERQVGMRYPQIFQRSHRQRNRCVALFAALVLINSISAAQSTTNDYPRPAWAQSMQQDPKSLAESGQLLEKLRQGVQFPPARDQSHLLPLLPKSTVIYVALPNYGEASHQALIIFQEELRRNDILRAWWQRGELAANGPKIEDALEKFYALSQFLGDETVVSASTEGRQGPSPLILAEVRKPGLKDFLQQLSKPPTDKSQPPFRVFDVQELAATTNTFRPQEPVLLVRPDLVVATLDFAQLRLHNAMLDAKGEEFASTPFGQRVAQVYEGGATIVGALDLQNILKQAPRGTDQNQMMFRRTGFADMKYLIWDHRTAAARSASEMELSFTGPRHGVASWLASPGPLGSLDFVSPEAILVSAIRLSDPGQIFDDIKDLSTASNPKAFAAVKQMEAALKLSLKEDLLSQLTGEIAFEVDRIKQPDPVWKLILQVRDWDRLQITLNKLLTVAPVKSQQAEDDGVMYHTLQIPAGTKAREVCYAFVDGYLIIASSRETLTEAVRLRRSGKSLAKSEMLLTALPPEPGSSGVRSSAVGSSGKGPEVSALLYEDPNAMAALNMRQILPAMADSLPQVANSKPMVICAYGEESAIREASLSRGVDAAGVLVVAAIAIPNLLRARISANEASAVATIRTANVAQISYSSAYPRRGFARDLATLGPDPAAPATPSPDHAGLLDATVGNASCTASAWRTKSGFQFRITAVCKQKSCDDYVIVGTPASSSTGSRIFCSTSDGVVRFKSGPPFASPVGVAECRAWSPLQ